MSTQEIGPATLTLKKRVGLYTLELKLGPIGSDITLANIRTAAIALDFMQDADGFVYDDVEFPREKEATTSYSKIAEGSPPVIWLQLNEPQATRGQA
ncbi:hypothetical protein FRC14_004525 [Serendipita sp. 396]|nr:hypothetical protein FRC14_004525 [Serendipita sp. 396]KAG8776628.1 hypothetical protein FRC15_011841 [Serendipita sp. 397]KAG8798155.1 hypothetical protein FRC16_007826 [Serendipita sp. 398]KAG8819384.1 hypothetical protein FRC18_012102 [Serendipita sp. 400]KAG8845324.1 hypothetical protein FRB91_001871 [Serendipita sp. 411]KAG8860459.1 hypothetical protein FRC20_011610 [Serendipita sp. 405]